MMSKNVFQKRDKRFRDGDFQVGDRLMSGCPTKDGDRDSQTLPDKDSDTTTQEFAETLGVHRGLPSPFNGQIKNYGKLVAAIDTFVVRTCEEGTPQKVGVIAEETRGGKFPLVNSYWR
ncbi:hypothetical protein M514_05159 [Trichuris suis]|uniref:Uncharacterized protein n=1 Tax=Trichuris suis TaxID=68888 RepID=A0A085MZW0_9BILA|nr:hypothetical protein M513_05159 [Trichuris suis]KFD62756.1 hypothetical protein M514_05159 [Trichuris suis]